MAREIVMPKLGLTMSEGTIAKWYVSEGDSISKGDRIMSVETDKLTNEVISDVDGVVRLILIPEGGVVPVKELVAVVAGAEEDISQYLDKKLDFSEADNIDVSIEISESKTEISKEKDKDVILATPYAKHLAKINNINLSSIHPTGYEGVIVARDVLKYKENAPKITGSAKNMAISKGVDYSEISKEGRIRKEDILAKIASSSKIEDISRVKATKIRRLIADNMLNNWKTSPMVTFDIDVNMEEVISLRNKLNKEYSEQGVKISYNHILIRILSKLLLKHKEINAYYDGEEIEYHNYVNLGLAVATDTGLVVPNLKKSDKLDLFEISVITEDLIQRTRENRIELFEMEGGTFTVSNLGMYGLKSFTPIINKPEVAILGVSVIRDEIVLKDDEIKPSKVSTFSLTADHSLVDGAVAGAFLKDFKKYMENPYLVL